MKNNLFIDISHKQQNCKSERICGDTFLYRHGDGGRRSVIVLSDGMGHGIKANILSSLTASMIVNFDYDHNSLRRMAEMILATLPICSVRKISYSTFTIVDIDTATNRAAIIEYDNPQSLIFRRGKPLKCQWECFSVGEDTTSRRKQTILTTSFDIEEGDRIVIMSDGVTQSGLGSEQYPFGWGRERVNEFVRFLIEGNPAIDSSTLCTRIITRAIAQDNYYTNDDVTCAAITIRKPNSILLCSCPPADESQRATLSDRIASFEGKKIICGYHLAGMLSELRGTPIRKEFLSPDPDIQPAWSMEEVDLITESLATLNKVYDILQNDDKRNELSEGPATDIYRMVMASDKIDILLGTNRGNGGVYMVDEYELRRKVMRHIAKILTRKYNKQVYIEYI